MTAKEIIAKARAKGEIAKGRPIYCEQTHEKWNSVQECADELGIKKYRLYSLLTGKTRHICGLTFKYGTPMNSKKKVLKH